MRRVSEESVADVCSYRDALRGVASKETRHLPSATRVKGDMPGVLCTMIEYTDSGYLLADK